MAVAYDVPILDTKPGTLTAFVSGKQKLVLWTLTYFSLMMDSMNLLLSFIHGHNRFVMFSIREMLQKMENFCDSSNNFSCAVHYFRISYPDFSNPGTRTAETPAAGDGVGKYLKAKIAPAASVNTLDSDVLAGSVVKKRKLGMPTGELKDFSAWKQLEEPLQHINLQNRRCRKFLPL